MGQIWPPLISVTTITTAGCHGHSKSSWAPWVALGHLGLLRNYGRLLPLKATLKDLHDFHFVQDVKDVEIKSAGAISKGDKL